MNRGVIQRILIADDHKMVREGLRHLIEKRDDLVVVGEADSGASAILQAEELAPELIIMDISMSGMNGIDATRKIVSTHPKIKVLMLSMHDDQQFVTESLKAGASGYLLKDCTYQELETAILEILSGRTYLCSKINEAVIKSFVAQSTGKSDSVFALLTVREREVLQMISEGLPTKVIAAELNLSIKTIESHRQQIMDKLDMHSVAELTRYAIKSGITKI